MMKQLTCLLLLLGITSSAHADTCSDKSYLQYLAKSVKLLRSDNSPAPEIPCAATEKAHLAWLATIDKEVEAALADGEISESETKLLASIATLGPNKAKEKSFALWLTYFDKRFEAATRLLSEVDKSNIHACAVNNCKVIKEHKYHLTDGERRLLELYVAIRPDVETDAGYMLWLEAYDKQTRSISDTMVQESEKEPALAALRLAMPKAATEKAYLAWIQRYGKLLQRKDDARFFFLQALLAAKPCTTGTKATAISERVQRMLPLYETAPHLVEDAKPGCAALEEDEGSQPSADAT